MNVKVAERRLEPKHGSNQFPKGADRMKGNIHKKATFEDKFARNFYCQHARLNSVRQDKKESRRKWRRINKEICKNA